tara:strand:- start:115 stop:435 length:321 start_codon:yes stop_codon:yes gene_type:complete
LHGDHIVIGHRRLRFWSGLWIEGALHGADANAGFIGNLARYSLRPTSYWCAGWFCAILSRNLSPRFQQFSITPDVFVALRPLLACVMGSVSLTVLDFAISLRRIAI